jgi:hypothetical protein
LLHARTVTGGAWVHAPPLELQNNRGSVAASPLLPLTGSENHCHLQKEKKTHKAVGFNFFLLVFGSVSLFLRLGRSVRFFFFPNLLCFRWLPASSPFPSLPVVVFCGKWRRIGRRRRMGGGCRLEGRSADTLCLWARGEQILHTPPTDQTCGGSAALLLLHSAPAVSSVGAAGGSCGCCFSVAVGSRPREKKALLTWPFAVEKTEEEDAAKERGLRC